MGILLALSALLAALFRLPICRRYPLLLTGEANMLGIEPLAHPQPPPSLSSKIRIYLDLH